ncbi:MAG: sialidase family protein [Gammaproteobacteria bacterium]|jgi:hypothetical protein
MQRLDCAGSFPFAGLLIALVAVSAGCVTGGGATHVNTYYNSDSAADDHARLTTDTQGQWLVVWASQHELGTLGTDWDVFRSWSQTNGQVWSNASPMNQTAATDLKTGDWQPDVTASTTGTAVAVWSSTNSLGGKIGDDEDIWFSRNPDLKLGGWSAAKPIHEASAAADGIFDLDEHPSLATDNKKTWVAVWMKSDMTESDILVSRSADDGITWSLPTLLNSELGTEAYFDYWPRVETDGSGTWIVTWNRDAGVAHMEPILHSISTDGGKNWSNSKQVHQHAVGYSPRIAYDGKSSWMIVWDSIADVSTGKTDKFRNIQLSRSSDGGNTWSAPAYLNTDWNPQNVFVGAPSNSNPDIATDGQGNWIAVWDLWQSTSLSAPDIRIAYSQDGGMTWTDPDYLNENWNTNTLSERWPQLATDRKGNWVVIWQTAAVANGNTSSDSDIATRRIVWPKP